MTEAVGNESQEMWEKKYGGGDSPGRTGRVTMVTPRLKSDSGLFSSNSALIQDQGSFSLKER